MKLEHPTFKGLLIVLMGPLLVLVTWLTLKGWQANVAATVDSPHQGSMLKALLIFLISIVIGAGISGHGLTQLWKGYKDAKRNERNVSDQRIPK